MTKHNKCQKNLWGVGRKQFINIFKGPFEFICSLAHFYTKWTNSLLLRSFSMLFYCVQQTIILTFESHVFVQELAFRLLEVSVPIYSNRSNSNSTPSYGHHTKTFRISWRNPFLGCGEWDGGEISLSPSFNQSALFSCWKWKFWIRDKLREFVIYPYMVKNTSEYM